MSANLTVVVFECNAGKIIINNKNLLLAYPDLDNFAYFPITSPGNFLLNDLSIRKFHQGENQSTQWAHTLLVAQIRYFKWSLMQANFFWALSYVEMLIAHQK